MKKILYSIVGRWHKELKVKEFSVLDYIERLFFNGLFRSSPQEVFYKKDVLKNFAKYTGKHLCQRLFFNIVAGFCQFQTVFLKNIFRRKQS